MSDYECFDCAHVVRAELRQLREQIAEALAEVPFHMTHSGTFALAKLTESLEALSSPSTVTQPDELEVTTLTKLDRDSEGGFYGNADTIAVMEPVTPEDEPRCEHGETEAHAFMERRQRDCEFPEGFCPGPSSVATPTEPVADELVREMVANGEGHLLSEAMKGVSTDEADDEPVKWCATCHLVQPCPHYPSQRCEHTEHETHDDQRIGKVPGGSDRFSHWEPCPTTGDNKP